MRVARASFAHFALVYSTIHSIRVHYHVSHTAAEQSGHVRLVRTAYGFAELQQTKPDGVAPLLVRLLLLAQFHPRFSPRRLS